jgi:hypothetical protein
MARGTVFSELTVLLDLKNCLHSHLPVVVSVCETWSVTLREEHRLSAFENRVHLRTECKGEYLNPRGIT